MKILKFFAISLIFVILTINAAYSTDFSVNAKAAMLAEADSGFVLFEQNPIEKCYPASLTKLMTALLVAEKGGFEEKITVTDSALMQLSDAGSSAGLVSGETLTVDQALICLLVASANEAANVLAQYVSGSVDAFVERMNERASELGFENTHFVNTHGLHDEEHYTCAKDLICLAREVLKHPRLVEICAMDRATIAPTNKSDERLFFNTNYLICPYKDRSYLYKYATGMKTGHTTPAGMCLVASAEKGDEKLISVVLGAKNENNVKGSFVETKKLFQWAFDSFSRKTLVSASEAIGEVTVRLAWDRDHVVVKPASPFTVLMPKDYNPEELVIEKSIPESVDAPVELGQKLGTMTVKYHDKTYTEIDLIASDSVSRSEILYILDMLRSFFTSPVGMIISIALISVLILFFIFRAGRRRARKSNSRRYRG